MELRVPTTENIEAANDCPSCDAYGICPSHKWIYDYFNMRFEDAKNNQKS